jgi:hypothetical protein
MSAGAGGQAGVGTLSLAARSTAVEQRQRSPIGKGEQRIGDADARLVTNGVELSVLVGLGVMVRIYDDEGREPLAEIATTAGHALRLSELFRAAALRADPGLAPIVPVKP